MKTRLIKPKGRAIIAMTLTAILTLASGLTAFLAVKDVEWGSNKISTGIGGNTQQEQSIVSANAVTDEFDATKGMHDISTGWVEKLAGNGMVYDLGMRQYIEGSKLFDSTGRFDFYNATSNPTGIYTQTKILGATDIPVGERGTVADGNQHMRFKYTIPVGEMISDIFVLPDNVGMFYPSPDADIVAVDTTYVPTYFPPYDVFTYVNRMSLVSFWGRMVGTTTFRLGILGVRSTQYGPYSWNGAIGTDMFNDEIAIDISIEVVENDDAVYNDISMIAKSDVSKRIYKGSISTWYSSEYFCEFTINDLVDATDYSEYKILGIDFTSIERARVTGSHKLQPLALEIDPATNQRTGQNYIRFQAQATRTLESYELLVQRTHNGKRYLSWIPVYVQNTSSTQESADLKHRNAAERTFTADSSGIITIPGTETKPVVDNIIISSTATIKPTFIIQQNFFDNSIFKSGAFVTGVSTSTLTNRVIGVNTLNIPYEYTLFVSGAGGPHNNMYTHASFLYYASNPQYPTLSPKALYPNSIPGEAKYKTFNVATKQGITISANEIAEISDSSATMEIVTISSYTSGMINASLVEKDGVKVLQVTGNELYTKYQQDAQGKYILDGNGNRIRTGNSLGTYADRAEIVVGIMNTTRNGGAKANGYGQVSYMSVYVTVEPEAADGTPIWARTRSPIVVSENTSQTIARGETAVYNIAKTNPTTIATDPDGDEIGTSKAGEALFRYRNKAGDDWIYGKHGDKVTKTDGTESRDIYEIKIESGAGSEELTDRNAVTVKGLGLLVYGGEVNHNI